MEDEPMDTVLSDVGSGLEGQAAAVGGARPLPLPRMRPPPSLRPDMAGSGRGLHGGKKGKNRQNKNGYGEWLIWEYSKKNQSAQD